MRKTDFYGRDDVVDSYIKLRYAGKSGAYVNDRELGAVKSLLPPAGRVLDIPCGVGRLTAVLNGAYEPVGADYSDAMIKASLQLYREVRQCDAAALPFEDKSFDAVVSLRFFIHYADIRPYLKEFKRVLKDDGLIIFERYTWTPLIFNVFQRSLGGKTFIHRRTKLLQALKEEGLQLVALRSCFLFSPYLYAHLPFAVVRALHRLEGVLPAGARVDEYWAVRKAAMPKGD